jgi:hypothetical protein
MLSVILAIPSLSSSLVARRVPWPRCRDRRAKPVSDLGSVAVADVCRSFRDCGESEGDSRVRVVWENDPFRRYSHPGAHWSYSLDQ